MANKSRRRKPWTGVPDFTHGGRRTWHTASELREELNRIEIALNDPNNRFYLEDVGRALGKTYEGVAKMINEHTFWTPKGAMLRRMHQATVNGEQSTAETAALVGRSAEHVSRLMRMVRAARDLALLTNVHHGYIVDPSDILYDWRRTRKNVEAFHRADDNGKRRIAEEFVAWHKGYGNDIHRPYIDPNHGRKDLIGLRTDKRRMKLGKRF